MHSRKSGNDIENGLWKFSRLLWDSEALLQAVHVFCGVLLVDFGY